MADANPYIGPTSFEEKDKGRFFGRDDETRNLVALLIARRAVLLYAQSGAGKTSLLKASVLPQLAEEVGVDVLPIARVTGAAADGNPYVANALSDLLGAAAAAGQSLADALAPRLARNEEDSEPTPSLLVFDQFEEIFTFHPEWRRERVAFFEQLGECLAAHPHTSLLLSMREDYLAEMDAYASYLPDRLRARMRLERLPYTAAIAAVAKPAAQAGKPFGPGVAEKLVDDLRRVQVGRGARTEQAPLGKYVEPVQLQIVCWQLWSRLPDEATTISAAEVEKFGDVDDALIQFYRDALREAQKASGVSERDLRRWFSEELITPARTRGLVYQGERDTAGLANAAVAVLRERYLVRADVRGDDTWFELAHDRLVEPILEDNKNWRAGYKNPVADAYEKWITTGRDPQKLINGTQLAECVSYESEHPDEVSEDERAFIRTSREEEKRKKRVRRVAALVGLFAMLLLSGLTAWAWQQRNHARKSAEDAADKAKAAQAAELDARQKAAELVKANGEVEAGLERAIHAEWTAVDESKRAAAALVQVQRSSSRLNLQQAERLWPEEPDKALGYAAEALRLDPSSLPARGWASSLLLRYRWWVPDGAVSMVDEKSPDSSLEIRSIGFSPDGRQVLAANRLEYCLWKAGNLTQASEPVMSNGRMFFAVFTPDGRRILWHDYELVNRRYVLRLQDAATTKTVWEVETPSQIQRAGFRKDGQRFYTLVGNEKAQVWDAESGKLLYEVGTDAKQAYNVRRSGYVKVPAVIHDAQFNRFGELSTFSYGVISRRDQQDGHQLGGPIGQAREMSAARFSADASRIAVIHPNWIVEIIDAVTGKAIDGSIQHQGPVTAAELTSDGRYVYTQSSDGLARVWEVGTGRLLGVVDRLKYWTLGAAFSADMGKLAVADRWTAKLWSTLDKSPAGVAGEEMLLGTSKPRQLWEKIGAKTKRVSSRAGAFSPDGRLLLAIDKEGAAQLWDLETRERVSGPLRHSDGITGVAFSHDGRSFLTVSRAAMQLWNTASRSRVRVMPAQSGRPFFAADFSWDDREVITTAAGAQLWNLETGELTRELTGSSSGSQPQLLAVSFSPGRANAGLWSSGDMGSHLQVLQRAWYTAPTAFETNGSTLSVAYRRDGRRIVTGDEGGRAMIWDVETGSPSGRPMVHREAVNAAEFSGDGRLVVTGSADGVVQVWDAESGASIGMPMRHPDAVVWVAFTPDGRRVATVGEDGAARVWTVLLGDGTARDTAMLADLAEAVSGSSSGRDAAKRARTIYEIRARVAKQKAAPWPAAGAFRRLLGVDQ